MEAMEQIRVDRGGGGVRFWQRHYIIQRGRRSSQNHWYAHSHVESTPQDTKACDQLAPLRRM